MSKELSKFLEISDRIVTSPENQQEVMMMDILKQYVLTYIIGTSK